MWVHLSGPIGALWIVVRLRYGRRVSTTLRQVFAEFSDFHVLEFPTKNFAPGSPSNDDRPLGGPIASPLLSRLKRISLFQSGSLRLHMPSPTGSASGLETGLLIQTSLGRAGGLGALRTKRSG